MTAKRKFTQDRAPESVGDDPDTLELVDVANLEKHETGVDGIIYVSTQQGSHAPRVKWYPSPPRSRGDACLSVTISPKPAVFNHRLPKSVADQASDPVTRWVVLNHDRLLDFWQNGWKWTRREVSSFFDRLGRI